MLTPVSLRLPVFILNFVFRSYFKKCKLKIEDKKYGFLCCVFIPYISCAGFPSEMRKLVVCNADKDRA